MSLSDGNIIILQFSLWLDEIELKEQFTPKTVSSLHADWKSGELS